MSFSIHQFAYNSDNYGVLVHDPDTGQTASVDAGDAEAVLKALQDTGWQLTQIWITHHHHDHTDGLAALKQATGATVYGPVSRGTSITGLDHALNDADSFAFGGTQVRVLHTPGHTLDMINFVLDDQNIVFTGDTLFVLGCGRLFEGDAAMMWDSLQKLMALPPETTVYCAHEYTVANAKFALGIDPDNTALQSLAAQVTRLRQDGIPTVPTTLQRELATNPFLRPHDPSIRAQLDMRDARDADVFARIRQLKDQA